MICNITVYHHGGCRLIADTKPKILLLDDDSSFVEVAACYLEKKLGRSALISQFTNSEYFFEYILSDCYLPESPQDILHSFYTNKINQTTIAQTLRDLSDLPALLIIDHQLQNEAITGVELTKKIREYIPCPFVVLLTAQLGTHNAVDLHNNEVIDLFVQKDGIHSLDYILSHLEKQIKRLRSQCDINIEDAFEFETMLEDEMYILKREELLNEIDYKSYLTISRQGEIALLTHNNQVKIFSYDNKVFSLNG